jgi:hypothetical protein
MFNDCGFFMVEKEYVVCGLCGRNRLVDVPGKGRVRWDFVDLGASEFIQVREGGGKVPGGKGYRGSAHGSGFHKVSAKTLVEVMDDPAYSDLVEGMKEQLLRLVRDGLRIGLIKKSELP